MTARSPRERVIQGTSVPAKAIEKNKNVSELTDGQISKLVGSTKGTVSLIRKRSYWNFSNLKPRDPVILALCTQESFQKSLEKAKRRIEREKNLNTRLYQKDKIDLMLFYGFVKMHQN